jgi:hypothetical protein
MCREYNQNPEKIRILIKFLSRIPGVGQQIIDALAEEAPSKPLFEGDASIFKNIKILSAVDGPNFKEQNRGPGNYFLTNRTFNAILSRFGSIR